MEISLERFWELGSHLSIRILLPALSASNYIFLFVYSLFLLLFSHGNLHRSRNIFFFVPSLTNHGYRRIWWPSDRKLRKSLRHLAKVDKPRRSGKGLRNSWGLQEDFHLEEVSRTFWRMKWPKKSEMKMWGCWCLHYLPFNEIPSTTSCRVLLGTIQFCSQTCESHAWEGLCLMVHVLIWEGRPGHDNGESLGNLGKEITVTKAEAGVMQSVPQTKDAQSLGVGKSQADLPHSLLRQWVQLYQQPDFSP